MECRYRHFRLVGRGRCWSPTECLSAVAARPEARRADSGRYAIAIVTTWKNKNDPTIRVIVFHFGNLEQLWVRVRANGPSKRILIIFNEGTAR